MPIDSGRLRELLAAFRAAARGRFVYDMAWHDITCHAMI